MNDKYNKYLSLYFLCFICILVVLNIVIKDKDFSESENRYLSSKPKFSVDRLIDGRFSKKYEKYVADQFVGRQLFTSMKSACDFALLKNEFNGVYLCDKGYLIEKFDKPDMDILSKNIKAINDFSSKYNYLNNYICVVPNAVSILDDYLPKFAPNADQKYYLNLLNKQLNKNIEFIDVSSTLEKKKDNYIYYKTDNHWTSLGAYTSFLEVAKKMNLDIDKGYYNPLEVNGDFVGSLASKSSLNTATKDTMNVYFPTYDSDEVIVTYYETQEKSPSLYNSKKLKTKDKYSMFLNGNHPVLKVDTTAKTNRNLLLIKDSYANSFVPFLTSSFNKIIVVDPRYFYEDIDSLIEEHGITDMLYLYNANTFFSDNSISSVLAD